MPQDNLFATTPGLEQQARPHRFTFNVLVPFSFNSNPEELNTAFGGGTNTAEFSPIVGLSFSSPLFDLPFRVTANVRAEVDRFTQAPSVDFDKVGGNARIQYIDPTNDQAYSPYVVYAPRWDFTPFYQSWFETRQDLSFGVNKTFNYDANFDGLPSPAIRWRRPSGRSASRHSSSGGSATPRHRRGPSS